MNSWERKKVEMELKAFTSRHFVAPSACKDLEQIRFYVKALCEKIDEYKVDKGFVPDYAYTLLAQYNVRQNLILGREFIGSYGSL